MFNTIRAKILIIIAVMLSALIAALSVFSYIYFKNSKQILIDAYYYAVSDSMESINRDIIKVEDNARDMAIFGEIFYRMDYSDRHQLFLDKFVLKIIADYRESISGGIWFKPYMIEPKTERFCSFAYLSKKNVVKLDKKYESEEFSYLKSDWYHDILSLLSDGRTIAWSRPYYENIGVDAFMVTAGVGIYYKGELVGISTADWDIGAIIKDVSEIKPTQNSFTLFADVKNDFILVSTDNYLDNTELLGKSLNNIPWYNDKLKNTKSFTYQGKKYIPYIKNMDNGMLLIVNIPENELFAHLFYRFVGLFVILIFFSIFLFLFLYFTLRTNIIKPIKKLTEIADKIGKGDTELSIKIDNPVEFARLAQSFDKMTKDIKDITEKQVALESELSIARSIQIASLPNIFPPYPERTEFDIFASMTPAKEVGGDFYDFYFIDSDTFMFLIADVAGKGIPAALFMMTIKTLIANTCRTQVSKEELIEKINRKICKNNKQGLFVTLFACVVNVNTGAVSYINCGHTPPLIKRAGGEYEYLKVPSNIVLGAFPKAKFNIVRADLEPGDRLFLYTDGVTETVNTKYDLFGEDRLKASLNNEPGLSLNDTLEKVKNNITDFAKEAKQSDDVTMLIFEYKGISDTRVFKDYATIENYKKFYPMLYSAAAAWNLDETTAGKIYMCAEEIYANVAFYAYPGTQGYIEAVVTKNENEIVMKFTDEGVAYNPLEKEDPDITIAPREKPLGGLGIFMVKKMADSVEYERIDNKNVLTIKFNNM